MTLLTQTPVIETLTEGLFGRCVEVRAIADEMIAVNVASGRR